MKNPHFFPRRAVYRAAHRLPDLGEPKSKSGAKKLEAPTPDPSPWYWEHGTRPPHSIPSCWVPASQTRCAPTTTIQKFNAPADMSLAIPLSPAAESDPPSSLEAVSPRSIIEADVRLDEWLSFQPLLPLRAPSN